MAQFTELQIRRALAGFCGANANTLLHYLTYVAAVESEAADGDTPSEDDLIALRAAIMEWLDEG